MTTRVLAIVQARMGSTRLPNKVLLPLQGQPALSRQLDRLRRARMVDSIVVATTADNSDDPIVELCDRIEVASYRGSVNDVLERFHGAVSATDATHVVRITADCPLLDPGVVDEVVRLLLTGGYDYASNTVRPTYPDGLDVEGLSRQCLELAHSTARDALSREHVTYYVHQRPQTFRIGSLEWREDLSAMRWTLDYEDDYRFIAAVYDALLPTNPAFSWGEVLSLLKRQPALASINSGHIRNEALVNAREDRT